MSLLSSSAAPRRHEVGSVARLTWLAPVNPTNNIITCQYIIKNIIAGCHCPFRQCCGGKQPAMILAAKSETARRVTGGVATGNGYLFVDGRLANSLRATRKTHQARAGLWAGADRATGPRIRTSEHKTSSLARLSVHDDFDIRYISSCDSPIDSASNFCQN